MLIETLPSFGTVPSAETVPPTGTHGLPVVLIDSLDDLLTSIAGADRLIATITAYRARLIEQTRQFAELRVRVAADGKLGGWDAATTAHRELATELACLLRIPERTAQTLVAHSQLLVHDLPSTLTALQSGEISYRHAQVIIDHGGSLSADSRAAFETAVLPAARRLTVARLERRARELRERLHPETIDQRHAKGVCDRSVTVTPDRDGMAWLNAYLGAAEAIAIENRLTAIVETLAVAGETRTRTQLKADIFADLLMDGAIPTMEGNELGRGIRATVLVTVPVLNLLRTGGSELASFEGLEPASVEGLEPASVEGLAPASPESSELASLEGSELASLEGYGPINAATAARLAAKAPSFTRILTHPETGAVLSVGRESYVVPHDLRRWLRVRDETCRFPGCGRRAGGCEVDHTVDWQHGGLTRYDNLAHLCAAHHHVKHHTRWSVQHVGAGVLEWASPAGRTYVTLPANPTGTDATGARATGARATETQGARTPPLIE